MERKGDEIKKEKSLFLASEPVLDVSGNLQWLRIKKKKVGAAPKQPMKKTIKEGKPLEEKKVFELRQQNLWECLKCGSEIPGNPDKPDYCDACKRRSSFKPITGMINPDLWILPKWEDLPVEDLNMLGMYDDMVRLIKSLLLFTEDIEYHIFALWIISTWKLESWDTVGYPVFIGIPESGKSRALEIMARLARRAPKASGVKAAAVPRLCHYHDITLLIDEAHSKLNPKSDSGSALLDFVKDGYKKGSVYITCDNNDHKKLIVTRNFGFKAFAGEKSFNPGLLSRSLIFYMFKGTPEIAKLNYAEDDFVKLRTKLLNYRYKTSEPPDLGNEFELKDRTREIFESIIATGMHIGLDISEIIEHAKERSKFEEEALKETNQYQILQIIKNKEGNPALDDAPEGIYTWTILNELGWTTGDISEDNKKSQSLGYYLKNMGLNTKGKGKKRIIMVQKEPNNKRLKNLYKRYKIEYQEEGVQCLP